MKTHYFRRALTISCAALAMAGIAPLPAADEKEGPKEAPLVKNLKDLRKLDQKLVKMAKPCAAATVSLVSRGGNGAGSGVIVSEDGLILTAAHVIAAMGEDVIVIFPDGSQKPAEKLGADFDRDAAMVRITEEGSYPHVKVGKSDDLLLNQWCVALGHPGGFDPMRTPPIRLGRILGTRQFIRSDCAVVGGDSGGPLFNTSGEVIGIHSNIGATLSENRHVPIGVYLGKWSEMKSGERTGRRFAGNNNQGVDPNRPVLGVQLGEPGSDGGVTVEGVMEKSPAEKAGLKEGDVILKVGDHAVKNREELIEKVGKFKAGQELTIVYGRDGEESEVTAKLVRLGSLMDLPPQGRERPQGRRPREPSPAEPKEQEDAAEEKKPAGGEENEEQAGEAEKKNPLAELLERGLRNGQLELTPQDLEKLGGMEELQKMMEELARGLGPKELQELMRRQGGSAGSDPFFESSMKALAPISKKAAASTVRIAVGGKVVALGTVVSDEGWILTKNAETSKDKVKVLIGGKPHPLKVVKRFPKRDLALFEMENPSDKLQPIAWANEKKKLPLGSLLTASAANGQPLGIGLVSVLPRAMGEVGFLGIQAGEAEDGVLVVQTTRGGPAGKAGLKKDDVILSVNGKTFDSPLAFGQHIRTFKAGDELALIYRRGEEKKDLNVTLAERSLDRTSGRLRRMNLMSGPLSEKLTGFPEALQHDIPLDPSQCGGPLLDLNGRCVGINVSRAGRVKTFAIPYSDVQAILEEARGGAPEVAQGGEDATRVEARAAVMKELTEIEIRLKAIEKKLEELKSR